MNSNDEGHRHGFGGQDHSRALRGASKRSLVSAFVLIAGFMFVEVIGGILSGSLALLADAGHMLTDAASIALALVAMQFATRRASAERTFGYHRLEILAALLNVFMLWLITGWVWFEAYHRFMDVPEVKGGLMLTVGVIGLFVNIGAAWILHGSAGHSVNVEGAFRHVMADLLGSVGVVISGTPHLGLRVDTGRSHYQRGYRHPDPRKHLASACQGGPRADRGHPRTY